MIPLNKARALAAKVCEELAPACDQIAIGGSIRRGLETVGNIDIIALPRLGQQGELARLFRGCAAVGGLMLDGVTAKRCKLRKSEVQCDLWVARHAVRDLITPTPCNWGGMLMTYTGSMDHNVRMLARAKALGKTFRPCWGVIDAEGKCHTTTEAEIFAALEMDFIDPENRI